MVNQFYLTNLAGITTPFQSGPGSNGNEAVFTFLKAPKLELYYRMKFRIIFRTLMGGGPYSSIKMQLAYSSVPANWTNYTLNYF